MDALLIGLNSVVQWNVLVSIVAGSVIGISIGVLPGIGPGVAIAVMLPVTYSMEPLAGIALLLGMYCGGFYGGAITSILIRTPGEASSLMTIFDGYPMSQSGQPGRALAIALTSGFVGGIISVCFLLVAARPLASFAGRFGAAEYAMAALLALVCVVKAYRGQLPAAALMLCLGLFVSTVGIDPTSQEVRFTLGSADLMMGFPIVSVVIGMFGMAQALVLLGSRPRCVSGTQVSDLQPPDAVPAKKADAPSNPSAGVHIGSLIEPLRYPATLGKSVTIGSLIGVLPAVGAALASSLSYFEARRSSPEPDSFGRGNPRGIVASEAANNAVSGGAMVPLLSLGIPGDAITAIILGAFIVHGIFPGPNLFMERPELVNGVMVSMLMINITVFLLLVGLTRYFALCVRVNPRVLGAVILALCFIGSYSVANSFYYTWIMFGFGIFGWLCALSGLPAIPLILGMVLGELLETSLRQALAISGGSPMIFIERPVSLFFVLAVALIVGSPLLRSLRASVFPQRASAG